jgi:hypothetical protein
LVQVADLVEVSKGQLTSQGQKKARHDLGGTAAGALVTLMISVRDYLRLYESGYRSKISEVKCHAKIIPSDGADPLPQVFPLIYY